MALPTHQSKSHCIGTKLNTKTLWSQNAKVRTEKVQGEQHTLQGEVQATVFNAEVVAF